MPEATEARVLIDTSALLALSHARDQHHARAVEIAGRHRSAGGTFVGTTLVLSEFYSHLLYLRDGAVARTALRHLLEDPIQSWVEGRRPTLDVVHKLIYQYLEQDRTSPTPWSCAR